MKCLARNKQNFYYALFLGTKDLTEDGFLTGETENLYKNPKIFKANISAASGEAVVKQFGTDLKYDRVIAMDKNGTPLIDESTVLWIDTIPRLDVNGELEKDDLGNIITPYDYVVVERSVSLNSISIAIKKVDVR